jgi:hypothetical protein
MGRWFSHRDRFARVHLGPRKITRFIAGFSFLKLCLVTLNPAIGVQV